MITVDRMHCIRSFLLKIIRVLNGTFLFINGPSGVHAVGVHYDFLLLFLLHNIHLPFQFFSKERKK